MEITTTTTDRTPRQAATTALALVGFLALILIGIGLAIYAARYVPAALNRLGAGAVSLSSVFSPSGEDPELAVVIPDPDAPFEPVTETEEEISFGGDTAPTASTGGSTAGTGGTGVVAGPPRTITVPVVIPPPAPYGRADLAVEITATGYCTSDRTSSFRSASRVSSGDHAGIQFTVSNIGTNVSGRWDFEYELPTSPTLSRTVTNQRALNPGDRVDYTLCFSEARTGTRTVTVRVDSGRHVDESNESNNTASARLDIR